MKINLYDNFEHLKKYNNIWIYSDSHFGDSDMIKSRQVTDEEQVQKINSVVGKKDVIIFLGDVGSTDQIKKIRGYKILVLGNHDAGASKYRRQLLKTATGEVIDNKLFDEVYTGIVPLNSKILLSHKPIYIPFMLNIHGHCHGKWFDDDTHLNTCAEHIGYLPVNLSAIIKSGRLKNIADINKVNTDVSGKKSKQQ